MRKVERKRRAAEARKKAKLAKRAKRLAAANTSPAGNGRGEAPATAAHKGRASEVGDVTSNAVADTGEGARATAVGKMPTADAGEPPTPQRSMPEVHSLEDEVHMAHSKMNRAEAEVTEAGTAEMLGDDEAIAMLTRAARSLDDVIQYVESVLKRLPAEQVAEAIAIKDEPRRHGEKSRNGANPAVQLLNIRLRAKNLLMRVMKVLKPNLAKQLQTA